MWHFVVIEIEKVHSWLEPCFNQDRVKVDSVRCNQHFPCWNILYKAPIDNTHDVMAFDACQVWLEQNKNETSKYAIMKMYIV